MFEAAIFTIKSLAMAVVLASLTFLVMFGLGLGKVNTGLAHVAGFVCSGAVLYWALLQSKVRKWVD